MEIFSALEEPQKAPPQRPAKPLQKRMEVFSLLNEDANRAEEPYKRENRQRQEQPRQPVQKNKLSKKQRMLYQQQNELPQPDEGGVAVKPPKKAKKIVLRVLGLGTIALLILIGAIAIMLLYTTRNDDLWLELDQIPYRNETILYYTDPLTGEVGEYTRLSSTQNKEYVDGSQMPQNLKHAFVAIEDKDFYEHNGVSLKRTAFAILNEAKRIVTGSYIGGDSGLKQGASTINQQLIKNLTRDDENSNMAGYMRKIREIYRAYKMDVTYDKDTILEAYLNTISFTSNTAGVQAEAKKLFNKTVDQLTLEECASLAAITRNPSRYNPVKNPEVHLERRNYVLYEMFTQGYITEAEYNTAVAAPLALNYQGEDKREEVVTSYFTDVVIESVVKELQDQRGLTRKEAVNLLYNGGLRVYTTVVPDLQASMERTMESGNIFPQTGQTTTKYVTDENGQTTMQTVTVYPQAAMVSMDYNGGICAVVGGLGEKTVSLGLNRATSVPRQVGSSMKPIGPYALALEKNRITWSSAYMDSPSIELKDETTGEVQLWPSNASRTYSNKEMLVDTAVAKSINTVAVRVAQEVGTEALYRFVKHDLGIDTIVRADKDYSPLALGSSTYGITPLDMAKAYAMFGNGGKVTDPYCFTKITSGTGQVYVTVKAKTRQAISSDTSYVMNRLLRDVMVSGTASGMSVPGNMDSVGKTGSSDDYRDRWFVGLTPYYVTATWYGYDENLPLPVTKGYNAATTAWRNVMQRAQANLPYREFATDESVVKLKYCTVSGSQAGANCPSATGYYRNGHLPQKTCPVHG
ncbi:MAG: transglycosylase domain-containing protein [Oscillospiraceae bacterium]